jgi:hypothetical protein
MITLRRIYHRHFKPKHQYYVDEDGAPVAEMPHLALMQRNCFAMALGLTST